MSTDTQANNKRIAKNTLYLYFRMIVVMIISLVTARYTLQLLGVEDYGIYNVVAGIIHFTGIITSTMVQATQRFLSFDLGKDDKTQFQKTFSMMMNIFIIICVILFLVMEIAGPYCITNYLKIPEPRLQAALWVFQFAILNFILDTINIPHTASIVAYERMNIYAYFTFLDVTFKLIAILSLFLLPYDKLIIYGLLNTLLCFVRNEIIHFYCRKKIEGCIYIKYWDGRYLKKLSSYIGWSLLGSTSSVMMGQGQSVLLNVFFGPIINAAKAIADRVKSLIYSFISNFYMAVTPQIIKTYATGDTNYTKKLVLSSSKYAFFLLFLLSTPVIFNMKSLLKLWLGDESVSNEMITFSQLTLLYGLVQVLECPITRVVQASSQVKKYEIVVGCVTLSFIPICYILFKLGLPATTSMLLLIIIYAITHIYRVIYVKSYIKLEFTEYMKTVILPIGVTVVISFVFIYLYHHYIYIYSENILYLMLFTSMDFIVVLLCIWITGLTYQDRITIKKLIAKKILKHE